MERKRDYLTTDEVQEIVLITGLVARLEAMIETWKKRVMLSPDEGKWLRMSATNTAKAINSILDSFPDKEREKISRKIANTDYIIKDKAFLHVTTQIAKKEHGEHLKYVEDMKDIGSELMYYTCKGCTEDHNSCMWHDIFEKYCFGESDEHFPNCKYAYNSAYVNESLRKTTNVVKIDRGISKKNERNNQKGTHNKDTSKSIKAKNL